MTLVQRARKLMERLKGQNFRSVVAYGLGPALGLASGPMLARALAPEGRGEFAAIMQPLTVAAAVASFGLPPAMAVFSARGYCAAGVFRVGVKFGLFFSAIVYLLLIPLALRVSLAQGIPLLMLLVPWIAVALLCVVQVRRGAWQGLSGWNLLDFEQAFYAILRFVLIAVLFLYAAASVDMFVAVSLGAIASGAVVLFLRPLPNEGATPRAAQILAYSSSSAIGAIMLVANSKLDQVLFPLSGTSRELGFYATAVSVAEVPVVLGTLASRNALTVSARGGTLGGVLRAVRLFLALGAISVVGLAVLSRYLIPLVFGEEFTGSVVPLVVLLGGSLCGIVALVLSAYVAGRGRPATSSCIPGVGLLVTIVGFVLMRGDVTALNAAIVSSVSQIVALGVGVFCALLIKGVRSCS